MFAGHGGGGVPRPFSDSHMYDRLTSLGRRESAQGPFPRVVRLGQVVPSHDSTGSGSLGATATGPINPIARRHRWIDRPNWLPPPTGPPPPAQRRGSSPMSSAASQATFRSSVSHVAPHFALPPAVAVQSPSPIPVFEPPGPGPASGFEVSAHGPEHSLTPANVSGSDSVAEEAPVVCRLCGALTGRCRGGVVWDEAMVLVCVPLAAPTGLSPLHIPTLRGSERVLVVSTEPPDDLSCLTTPGVGRPGDGLWPVRLTRGTQRHTSSPCGGLPTPADRTRSPFPGSGPGRRCCAVSGGRSIHKGRQQPLNCLVHASPYQVGSHSACQTCPVPPPPRYPFVRIILPSSLDLRISAIWPADHGPSSRAGGHCSMHTVHHEGPGKALGLGARYRSIAVLDHRSLEGVVAQPQRRECPEEATALNVPVQEIGGVAAQRRHRRRESAQVRRLWPSGMCCAVTCCCVRGAWRAFCITKQGLLSGAAVLSRKSG